MALRQTLRFITTHPLTRSHPVAAVARFVRWQVWSRLTRRAVTWDWVGGTRFWVRSGETGMTGNVYVGLHEFEEMAFVLHVLREGDLFVDVGANAGAYTLLAAASVGADVVACEPVPDAFARLQSNVALNQIDGRVECVQTAIGAAAGRLTFSADRDTMNQVVDPDGYGGETVEVVVTTLDALLGQRRPTVLKVDVEGHEMAVLEGAARALADPMLQAIIVECNDERGVEGVAGSSVIETIRAAGFYPVRYRPSERTLDREASIRSDANNVLFVRDLAWVEARSSSAGSFEVLGTKL